MHSLFLNLLYRITGYSTAIPKIATIVVIEGDPSHLVYAHVVKSIWTHFLNGAVFTEQGVVQVVKVNTLRVAFLLKTIRM